MHHAADIFMIVLPIFLVTGLGFSLKGTGLVDASFIFQLNRLIYYVALPALLFYKIATAEFSASFSPALLAGMLLSTVVLFGLSYVYGKLRGYSAPVRGAFCQGAFRGNLAYIGLAIVFNTYGEAGFAIAGILIGFLVPVLNFLAVIALILPQQSGKHHLGRAFWTYQLLFNPIIVAAFVGILWSFLRIPMPVVLDRALGILTGMSLPLALLAIGASFTLQKIKGELLIALLASAVKIVGAPLLTAAILLLFGIRGTELGVGLILAGTPTATAVYIMAQQLNGDAELSGAVVMLSTVLSVLSYSIMLLLLRANGI